MVEILRKMPQAHFVIVCSFTVGPGVSPGQPLTRVADCTASGEFHPALKTFDSAVKLIIAYCRRIATAISPSSFRGSHIPSKSFKILY